MQVTERDVRVLGWIGQQFIVNSQELGVLLQLDALQFHLKPLGEYVVRDMLGRWKRAGLVKTVYQLRRGSHVYLTARGIKLAGLPYSHRTPGLSDVAHLTHHDGVNVVRLHMEYLAWARREALIWVPERSLMQHEQAFTAENPTAKRPHRPDAVVYHGNMQLAVEVELAYKRPARHKRILHEYLYGTDYDRVQFYCATHHLEHGIGRALDAVLADLSQPEAEQLREKIQILSLPDYA